MGFNRERGLPRVPTVHVTRMRTSQRARYHFMGCVCVRNRHLLCHSKVLRSAPFLQFSQATHLPTPLALAGGASKLTTTFLKRLASLLAERLNEPYCVAMAWLRARLSFSLLRSAIACLRSSRRKFHIDSEELHPTLAVGQAGLPT